MENPALFGPLRNYGFTIPSLSTVRPVKPQQVLVIEDDRELGNLIQTLLERTGHAVTVISDGASALSRAHEEPPDLIVLDVYMPEINGFTMARRLQESDRTRHVPIIFVTVAGGTAQMVEGLDLGAVDYIVKPFIAPELVARVRTALRRKAMEDELTSLAMIDSLTGMYNHRYLMDTLEKSIQHSARHNEAFSCLMLDIDYFKQVNDRFGHAQGDAILKDMAVVLDRALRSADIAGRYGGEEFAVLCRSTRLPAALLLAERLRVAIEAYAFEGLDRPIPLTASIGCAAYDPTRDADGAALLARADAALYQAKRAGRNCVRGE